MNRWLELIHEFAPDELTLLAVVEKLSDNGISIVWRGKGEIYKRSIPFLIQNEIYILRRLQHTGYVPRAMRLDRFTIAMDDLGESQPVTDVDKFMQHKQRILGELGAYGIRHGDLTTAAVIVKDNHPYIIDWAESRLACDPRPDKRPPNDEYWINKTWEQLCKQ